VTFRKNPEPAHPDTHTTRVTSNDRFVCAAIALGDLLYVRRYSAWHNTEALFEVRFRRGTIDMSAATLTEIVRQGQEALASAPRDAEISGSAADLGESA
jgi:hypothetical protein